MEWTELDLGLILAYPQCVQISDGRAIVIIGGEQDDSVYLIDTQRGCLRRIKSAKYPFEPRGHAVVSCHDGARWKKTVWRLVETWGHPLRVPMDVIGLIHRFARKLDEFFSFGGMTEHFYRIVFPHGMIKCIREDIGSESSTSDGALAAARRRRTSKIPGFGTSPKGLFQDGPNWSHLFVSGGRWNGHERSVSIIHLPWYDVKTYKGILPIDFSYHGMVQSPSLLSANQFGFILIRNTLNLQCIYHKDRDAWAFKQLAEPPGVREYFHSFGCILYRNEWVLCVGGFVDTDDSRLIRCYNVKRDEWIVSSVQLPKRLCGMGLRIIKDRLYVIGGYVSSLLYTVPLATVLPVQRKPPSIVHDWRMVD